MKCQKVIVIICVVIFIACCIVCVCYRKRNNENKKNKKKENVNWEYKKYKIRIISIIIGCIFLGIAMMFMLNIIFYKNIFYIESDLNDKEAFSLIIAFLTLIATVLIAIVQFMSQDRIKKEEEKRNKNYQKEQNKQELYKKMEEITRSLNENVKIFNFLYNDLSIFTDGMFCCFDDTSESFVVSFDLGYVVLYHSLQIKTIKISGMNSYQHGMTIEGDLIKIENDKLNILLKENSRNPVILAINKFLTTSTFYNACFGVEITFFDDSSADGCQASIKLVIRLTSLRDSLSADSNIIIDGICNGQIIDRTIEQIKQIKNNQDDK